MTREEFLQVFNRLCVALREPADDTGITQETYYTALSDLSLTALQAGSAALMMERGRKFFPTTAEWRTAAIDAIRAQSRVALPAGRTEPWRHDCEQCEDTGWVQGLGCNGTNQCGREKQHLPHSYTRPCLCRATNRTYQRHQQNGRVA